MYRDAEVRVQEWIDNSKKALLIYGARQVGKTWLIREMLGRNRIPYFEVNLLERQDILNRLNTVHDAGEMIDLLKLYSPQPLEDGKAVVFLDEIQVYPLTSGGPPSTVSIFGLAGPGAVPVLHRCITS